MTDSISQTKTLRNTIEKCLNLESPKSFFLFAGAGSGKTRALTDAMKMFREKYGQEFRRSARKVAVITYTNAACDEIKHRIEYDPVFAVSTIHSFAWVLIQSFPNDIREWLRNNLEMEIDVLEEKQKKGRRGKAADDRSVKIETKRKRLSRLDSIKSFAYSPNGENIGKNSLNHAEVIGITADFLTNKPLMQRILICKYPVLLIDESQDTQKDLVDAFFTVQSKHSGEFCLSLFGDTMQRIYSEGKIDLDKAIPDDWEKPAIITNHRCPKRIVRFINAIRAGADGQKQEPRDDALDGFIRLFLVQNNDELDKAATEARIADMMAEVTSDEQWSGNLQEIKTLTLEHHMAAKRGGFSGFFEPLYTNKKLKDGVLKGTLSGIPFFSQQVLPLVIALKSNDKFAVAKIVKKYSPLISADQLKNSVSPLEDLAKADGAVKSLFSLWDDDSDPLLIELLKAIATSGLFLIPDVFAPIVLRKDSVKAVSESGDTADTSDNDPNIDAWDEALSAPFSQLQYYVQYISDKSPFGTHQGIKGLQFPRVMVVLDDFEARGWMFSYDRLLGAQEATVTDLKNEKEGKETSSDRTRRLFYVTCSRAQSSLAIVVYTSDPEKIIGHLQNKKWFDDGEIIAFGNETLNRPGFSGDFIT